MRTKVKKWKFLFLSISHSKHLCGNIFIPDAPSVFKEGTNWAFSHSHLIYSSISSCLCKLKRLKTVWKIGYSNKVYFSVSIVLPFWPTVQYQWPMEVVEAVNMEEEDLAVHALSWIQQPQIALGHLERAVLTLQASW